MNPSRRSIAAAAATSPLLHRAASAKPGADDRALQAIRAMDYVIVRARDLGAMRAFYENVLGWPIHRALFDDKWIEFRIGGTLLTVTTIGFLAEEPALAPGRAAVQFAFRVAPKEVDACADALRRKGVAILSEPTNQPWGHRTLFFRDPDGNILEIYADI